MICLIISSDIIRIDPINNNELLSTKINRVIEKIIFKKINVKRGEYYD